MKKIVVTVPLTHAEQVREAIGKAGGGKLGSYSFCSFSTLGVGRFKPEAEACPYIGSVGQMETVEEERIEISVEASLVQGVIGAIKKAHPYEEVALDLYNLEN